MVYDPIEHIFKMHFRTQRSTEVDQCLANVVPVTIKKLIQPDLELVFDRREQKSCHDRRNNARQTT